MIESWGLPCVADDRKGQRMVKTPLVSCWLVASIRTVMAVTGIRVVETLRVRVDLEGKCTGTNYVEIKWSSRNHMKLLTYIGRRPILRREI